MVARRAHNPEVAGSSPVSATKKTTSFNLSFFYPLRMQWHIITLLRVYHRRKAYIISRRLCFRNDDMIYKAYALICFKSFMSTRNQQKNLEIVEKIAVLRFFLLVF